MIFRMEIESNNAAFEPDVAKDEVTRLLRRVIDKINFGDVEGGLWDSNGNRVGYWVMEQGVD